MFEVCRPATNLKYDFRMESTICNGHGSMFGQRGTYNEVCTVTCDTVGSKMQLHLKCMNSTYML